MAAANKARAAKRKHDVETRMAAVYESTSADPTWTLTLATPDPSVPLRSPASKRPRLDPTSSCPPPQMKAAVTTATVSKTGPTMSVSTRASHARSVIETAPNLPHISVSSFISPTPAAADQNNDISNVYSTAMALAGQSLASPIAGHGPSASQLCPSVADIASTSRTDDVAGPADAPMLNLAELSTADNTTQLFPDDSPSSQPLEIADDPFISSCSFLLVDSPTALICQDCCVMVTSPAHHLATVHAMKLSKEQRLTARLLPAPPVTAKPFEVVEALPFIPVESGFMCSHCGRCFKQEASFMSAKCCDEVPQRFLRRVYFQTLLSASNLPSLVPVVPRQHQTKIEEIVFVGEVKHSDVWKQKCLVAEDSLAYALATIGELQAHIDDMKRQTALNQGKMRKVASAISGLLTTD
jgi:hypothetical protein